MTFPEYRLSASSLRLRQSPTLCNWDFRALRLYRSTGRPVYGFAALLHLDYANS